MLYQLHDLHRASLVPIRLWATANLALYGCPFSPLSYNPMSRFIVAGADLLLRTTHRYAKPRFGLDETVVEGKAVSVVEEKVLEEPFCTLLHFKRDANVEQ